ncbi:nucleotidyl transferase AbiEii/AbiGii toxin family protein [Crossiella sp. CA-258035]|uniref:nucleotidyl transferase AbiEii/AbiGii toxin family protein n=1 Tax=Crossiella sp. CA-258035 TaxID=2981138 RepID=UPI0024BC9E55|nr:nucleotidyl transferase AbiEii/AbiGii toxin family protein [Crossiella sp. CA-258035]WHT21665.1 nucleotidyl transferase AbiEii/AbiGii toxin family protein [Crossiella sp. CA-258035]
MLRNPCDKHSRFFCDSGSPHAIHLEFDVDSATAETIRDEDDYSGVRVTMTGRLAAARLSLHVDVNVGDPVWPEPQTVLLPRLLADPLPIMGYPLAMVHAEKITTAVQRGTANTRWRDFADVYLLSRRHDVSGNELRTAFTTVAAHRKVDLVALGEVLDGFAELAQSRWLAWRRKQRLAEHVPASFAEVLAWVTAFADPCLADQTGGKNWLAADGHWR